MTSYGIMRHLAYLAHSAHTIGDTALYRSCEALAFEWVCAEVELMREGLIDLFPWGLDIA